MRPLFAYRNIWLNAGEHFVQLFILERSLKGHQCTFPEGLEDLVGDGQVNFTLRHWHVTFLLQRWLDLLGRLPDA